MRRQGQEFHQQNGRAKGGSLYLTSQIWRIYDEPKPIDPASGKLTLAEGVFLYNNTLFDCWIHVFAGENMWDTNHRHLHKEMIVQLAGSTSYQILPSNGSDPDEQKHILGPAEQLIVPAGVAHLLDVYNSPTDDSLSLSIVERYTA